MHAAADAALTLCTALLAGDHLDSLPAAQRPQTRAEGYAVQACWPAHLGGVAGWKIAATSLAGQRHIGVSGPLAGPVFAQRLRSASEPVSLAHNRMRVAECEIVFHFASALPPRAEPYSTDEVLAALHGVGPGIEVPDSRFLAFETAGEAQLIADGACCNDMLLGPAQAASADALRGLAALQVQAQVSDGRVLKGQGSNVLGDPLVALVWLVNELRSHGQTLAAGQFVTTGACVVPIPVQPGQAVTADFGWLGPFGASFG